MPESGTVPPTVTVEPDTPGVSARPAEAPATAASATATTRRATILTRIGATLHSPPGASRLSRARPDDGVRADGPCDPAPGRDALRAQGDRHPAARPVARAHDVRRRLPPRPGARRRARARARSARRDALLEPRG